MPDSPSSVTTVNRRSRLVLLLGVLILLAAGAVWHWRGRQDEAVEEESWERRTSTLIAAVQSWQGVALISDNEAGRFPEGPEDLSPTMAAFVADPEKKIFHAGPQVLWVPVRHKPSEGAGSGMHALMLVVEDPHPVADGLRRYYCTFVRRRGLFSERNPKDVPTDQVWLRMKDGDWQLPLPSLNNNASDAQYHYKYEYEGNGGRTPYTLDEIMLIHARLLQDAHEAAQPSGKQA